MDRDKLVATFVSTGPLFAILSTSDNQIIYGRRGTGKTHALKYLAESVENGGDFAIYIDLRQIGSEGSLYGNPSVELSERASRLLIDVLGDVHERLYELCLRYIDEINSSNIGNYLDALATAISTVRVIGQIEQESTGRATSEATTEARIAAGLTGHQAAVGFGSTEIARRTIEGGARRLEKGVVQYHIHFGTIGASVRDLLSTFRGRRFWLLLDEWSSIPLDLQPYLADLIRRALFPIPSLTVKIAAIEHRSVFQLSADTGQNYIGIELGADAQANLNLDDFMVFDNDQVRARQFFKRLLFKHFRATEDLQPDEGPQNEDDFVSAAFTQITAFDEFVRAVEGVPRDAINIAEIAAQRADDSPIAVATVRAAARDWYLRDKAPVVHSNPKSSKLLEWIMEEVIAHRKARAFLIRTDQKDLLIDRLFDGRLIHLLKRSVSSNEEPGIRYIVYKLDYGCYVELINTQKAPEGLLPWDDGEESGYVDVPPDDYRSIRRAILKLEEFYSASGAEAPALSLERGEALREGRR